MEYKVAYGRSASEIEAAVNGLIGIGWTPIGGLSIDKSGQFFQALTSTNRSRFDASMGPGVLMRQDLFEPKDL